MFPTLHAYIRGDKVDLFTLVRYRVDLCTVPYIQYFICARLPSGETSRSWRAMDNPADRQWREVDLHVPELEPVRSSRDLAHSPLAPPLQEARVHIYIIRGFDNQFVSLSIAQVFRWYMEDSTMQRPYILTFVNAIEGLYTRTYVMSVVSKTRIKGVLIDGQQ